MHNLELMVTDTNIVDHVNPSKVDKNEYNIPSNQRSTHLLWLHTLRVMVVTLIFQSTKSGSHTFQLEFYTQSYIRHKER